MSCIRCGEDVIGNERICTKCLKNWITMRTELWNKLITKYGNLNQHNHPIIKKEMKRMENIWRKNKKRYLDELNKL